MNLKGKINNLYFKFGTKNKIILELELEDAEMPELEKYKDIDLDIKIDKRVEKRSLNANRYMWYLLGECSKKLDTTNIELYKKYVKEFRHI